MQITLTPLADLGVRTLPPDIIWAGVNGDFRICADPRDGGVGGFVAGNPLATAVLILLFSDARIDPQAVGLSDESDPRGWPGDGFDVDAVAGEGPMGSQLWRLRREVVETGTLRDAEQMVRDALAPLIRQGICDRVEAVATFVPLADRMTVRVVIYERERAIFQQAYDTLWGARDSGL